MILLEYPWIDFRKGLKVSSETFQFLERARALAKREGLFLYLAGGPVRDVLLGRDSKDLDLVLEGDWKLLLNSLIRETGASLLLKSQFLTFKLALNFISTLDLVTARKEVYPYPASLPEVKPGTFEDDIRRRDFTVNALIYGLTPPYEEKIIDLVGGLKDLENRVMRPLHIHSFVEDPTRAFRGIRYKVRLNFSFGCEFLKALKIAEESSSFRRLSSSRLVNELKLFINKEAPECLPSLCEELNTLGLLQLVGLLIRKPKQSDFSILDRARGRLSSESFEKFFRLFLIEIDESSLRRLAFSEREITIILRNVKALRELKKNWKNISLVERVELLEKSPDYLLFRLSLEEEWREDIKAFWEKWQSIKPELTGQDLIALGLSEGREIGFVLKRIREEKLKGNLLSKEAEKEFVKNLIFQRC
ncbi:MAG: hypothetical protein N2Z40_00910 [Caldimicrobium sp.]|nr:hypothetical protein [Caldimicrobium sp.]MCX7612773.1 hypothetical protein [Caldimicrobium sp.]MDW8182125.1 hypothetical protein [Caldimicrobium sp.]